MVSCCNFLRGTDHWAGKVASDFDLESEVLANLLLAIADTIPDFIYKIQPGSLSLKLIAECEWNQQNAASRPVDEVHRCQPNYQAKIQADSELARAVNWISRKLESFADQAIANWKNPNCELGFTRWLHEDLHSRRILLNDWERKIYQALNKIDLSDSKTALRLLLIESGVTQDEWPATLLHTAYTLKGWCGIINRQDQDPSIFPVNKANIGLVDLLVVLLVARLNCNNAPAPSHTEHLVKDTDAFNIRLVDYFLGRVGLNQTRKMLDSGRLQHFAASIQTINRLSAREIWHGAFEISVYKRGLSCIAAGAEANHQSQIPSAPRRQSTSVWFCIDDREESIRRHFESIEPDIKTHGVLGFFGIDMKLRSAHHPIPKIHCPPVITPRRVVVEEYVDPLPSSPSRMALRFGSQHFATMFSNRGLLVGALSSLIIGMLSFLPLSIAIIAPRLSSRLRKKIRYSEHFRRRTRIILEPKSDPLLGETGFSITEQAELVRDFIQLSSLEDKLSRINVLMAHGGTNTNNPFRQSYGCGACSGQSGGANARVFAQMANDRRVRMELEKIGFDLGPDIHFVAAEHDTTTDEIKLLDADHMPQEIKADLHNIFVSLQRSADLNAQERIRRFPNAPYFRRRRYAREHVQMRAMNLAEPRPEYGHAGVCMAVFGSRKLTQNLFLDRRSFLIDYDPNSDKGGEVLQNIMRAAAPVCANIAMDYYISAIDPHRFGAGTKLPLNVSSLLGVIAGGSGDLKIGLANQMIERHEPVRVMIVVEASPEMIERALSSTPRLLTLANNHWIRIASVDLNTGMVLCRFDGKWEKPELLGRALPAFDLAKATSLEFESLPSTERIGLWNRLAQSAEVRN